MFQEIEPNALFKLLLLKKIHLKKYYNNYCEFEMYQKDSKSTYLLLLTV